MVTAPQQSSNFQQRHHQSHLDTPRHVVNLMFILKTFCAIKKKKSNESKSPTAHTWKRRDGGPTSFEDECLTTVLAGTGCIVGNVVDLHLRPRGTEQSSTSKWLMCCHIWEIKALRLLHTHCSQTYRLGPQLKTKTQHQCCVFASSYNDFISFLHNRGCENPSLTMTCCISK